MEFMMQQGKAQFGEGGLNHDVINSAKLAGIVPQSVYSGLVGTASNHDHLKMGEELEKAVKKHTNPEVKLDPNWKNKITRILDKYMGKDVTEFTFEGKTYTPKSFLDMTQIETR